MDLAHRPADLTQLAAQLAHDMPDHPSLFCPFTSSISPHADTVQTSTTTWAQQFGLLTSAAAVERFTRRQYGILIGRAYPTADLDTLTLISDWNTWLFALDDQCDEDALGRDLMAMTALHKRILAILHGAMPNRSDARHLHALYNLVLRFRVLQPEPWLHRLIRHVDAYFLANQWEAHNRIEGLVPSEANYLAYRPYTGAVYCYITLIELAQHIMLPDTVVADSAVHRLAELTNQVICWSNDIISLQKELAGGDFHNLVYVLYQGYGCSIEDAINEVAQRHDAAVAEFIAIREQCTSPLYDDMAIQYYFDNMQAWMRANLDWSAATSRYRPREI
ncbi:MAG: hypothetical protein GFH27_549287n39 [Chloroflexi bacterium AL-W]|nr:hypothetical protein [Chloroflexi bacterium AL-W]